MNQSVDLFDYSEDDFVKGKIKEASAIKELSAELSGKELVRMDKTVETLLNAEKKKTAIEQSAWKELEAAFGNKKVCRTCYGAKEFIGKDGTHTDCPVCMGTGTTPDINMRAVELVLGPKYPKTSVNLNADMDKMSPEAMIEVLSKILT